MTWSLSRAEKGVCCVIGYFVTFRKRFCPLDPFAEGNSYLTSTAFTCLEWAAVIAFVYQIQVVQRRTGWRVWTMCIIRRKKFANNISYAWLLEWYVDLLSCVRPGAHHQVTRVSVVRPGRQVCWTGRCVLRRWDAPYFALIVDDAVCTSHVWCEWCLVSTANQGCVNCGARWWYRCSKSSSLHQGDRV